MFSDAQNPRLFGLPPGADFARVVVQGLEQRMLGHPPESLARVTVYVNTRRMQRRIVQIFDAGPARLLPRIRLITDLGNDPVALGLAPAVAPLRRRLELSKYVAGLLDRQPDLAPRTALFDLSDSLAKLLDEMQGEGVPPDRIAALDVTDLSGHWERSLSFLRIVQRYFGDTTEAPDQEARQRLVIEQLVAEWAKNPATDPVIVAGSTGSRGATALFLQAVARLPQGAVILPGFDFDLPDSVWDALSDPLTAEDHPQFRFRRLMDDLGVKSGEVARWVDVPAPCPARNRLISLSLRPAPVTDQWLQDGPLLGDLTGATCDMTLVQAASPRQEADVIALRLRQAVADGITAALITPDRMLTRQVAAALDRWNIVPDDSAGLPLPLSPPGRFLRQVVDLFNNKLTAEALLSLLKHPLCHTGADRNLHLLATRDLELELRRNGPAFPTGTSLRDWADKAKKHHDWANWLAQLLDGTGTPETLPLVDHLLAHLDLAQALAAGPKQTGSGTLWLESAGRQAKSVCDMITANADAGGALTAGDYAALFNTVLNGAEVRNPDIAHPQVLIWGTLEARVQGADLIILGGMNDGTWPETPKPDPWLNRVMRQKAGLLLPERRIGLSAHDYSQAIAGREVWITRSARSDDAETVASRWINRLTNLLDGLPDQGGPAALREMRARGDAWLAKAALVSEPEARVPTATRPSPRPPLHARPKRLSVTRIKTLIRDPYAIYAEFVLRLRQLDPLTPSPDAPMRGVVLHSVMEQFSRAKIRPDAPDARAEFLRIATRVLDTECPWPTVRKLWLARIDRVADWFLHTETARRLIAEPRFFETTGEVALDQVDFTLSAKADRFDIAPDGSVLIFDYKTGTVPSKKQQQFFDKQLLLEAAMVEAGAFAALGTASVIASSYIGLGPNPTEVAAPLGEINPSAIWAEFHTLMRAWADPKRGYSARMFMQKTTETGFYDHLARFGEWDDTAAVVPEDLS